MSGQVISEMITNRKENIPLKFSEDCLYLNIYTPADLSKKTRLPVSSSEKLGVGQGAGGSRDRRKETAQGSVIFGDPGGSFYSHSYEKTAKLHTSFLLVAGSVLGACWASLCTVQLPHNVSGEEKVGYS